MTRLQIAAFIFAVLIVSGLSLQSAVIDVRQIGSDSQSSMYQYQLSRADDYTNSTNDTNIDPEINPEFNLSLGNFSFPDELVSMLSAVCVMTVVLLGILIIFVLILTYRNYKEGKYYSSMIEKKGKGGKL